MKNLINSYKEKKNNKRHEEAYNQACIDELPSIKIKRDKVVEELQKIEQVLMDSNQAETFLKLKTLYQQLSFQESRLDHHKKLQIEQYFR